MEAKRISLEQREMMLHFMQHHKCLATGRFTAPDGAKEKQRLMLQFSESLNSIANGASKTPDKWMKSWQDWKCDVKGKAALLKREMAKTGGGSLTAKTLSPLEERLLDFLGPSIAYGNQEVTDPMGAVTASVEAGSFVDGDTFIMPLDFDLGLFPTSNTPVPTNCPTPVSLSQPSNVPEAIPNPSAVPSSPIPPLPTQPLLNPNPQYSNNENGRPSSAPKRAKRTGSTTADDEGTELVALTRRQVEIAERQVEIAEEGLVLQRQYTAAFVRAADALCSALQWHMNQNK